MEEKDFTFFVKSHKWKRTHKGMKYTLELETGTGHKLVFKGDTEDLFVGFPIGTPVGIKLGNPQTTLPKE